MEEGPLARIVVLGFVGGLLVVFGFMVLFFGGGYDCPAGGCFSPMPPPAGLYSLLFLAGASLLGGALVMGFRARAE